MSHQLHGIGGATDHEQPRLHRLISHGGRLQARHLPREGYFGLQGCSTAEVDVEAVELIVLLIYHGVVEEISIEVK